MRDLNELRRQRGNIVKQMRELTDAAEKEHKAGTRTTPALTAEEDARFTRMDNDQEAINKEVVREERTVALESERTETRRDPVKPEGDLPYKPGKRDTPAYRKSFEACLRYGRKEAESYVDMTEFRDMQSDISTSGGYISTPQEFINTLIQTLDNSLQIRALATKFRVDKAVSLGAPALQDDIGDPEWTAEIKTGSDDTTMDFGNRDFFPHPVARRIKVSNKLIRVSVLSVEALIRQRLEYKLGVVQEKAFMVGTGANQPLGLFTASDQGIPTSRDVSTGNTSTGIGADNLFEIQGSLKPQYLSRPSVRWIFHRTALKNIRKLKDGNGQYYWQPGLQVGQPDTILGIRVINSEYAPATFTTGLYVGLLGDLSFYWIVDALDATIRILNELYAETDQTGYIIRAESDGMPVLGEAFARIQLA